MIALTVVQNMANRALSAMIKNAQNASADIYQIDQKRAKMVEYIVDNQLKAAESH